jgi:hypothetical protein
MIARQASFSDAKAASTAAAARARTDTRKIAAALRTMVPGEGVIEQKTGRRHYVTDGRTAYRALPRHRPQYVRRGPAEFGWSCAVDLGGNDWFVIPVELNVGSLYRTRSLVITDTFGIRTLIKSSSELGAPYSTWRMFQHSYLPASNLFLLSPSLLKSLEGHPIEEVLFLRDEMSNLAWAVERCSRHPHWAGRGRDSRNRTLAPAASRICQRRSMDGAPSEGCSAAEECPDGARVDP